MSSIKEALLGLDLGLVQILSWVMMALSCLLVFALICSINVDEVSKSLKKKQKKFRDTSVAMMKSQKGGLFDYQNIEVFLNKYGITYMTAGLVDPIYYIGLRFLSALFIALIGGSIHIVCVPIGFALGFVLPRLIFVTYDKKSNEDMMVDIKGIYDTLRIQTKAGVYITNTLSRCYLGVKNKRLKTALIELTNTIMMQGDIDLAIDDFQAKFNNQYIDNFCVAVRQSQESGKSAKLLDDISNQLVDMQNAINYKRKERLQSKIVGIQMACYVGILVVLMYAFATTLIGELGSF